MKNALLFVSLAASPVCAQEVAPSTTSSPGSSTTTTTLVVPAVSESSGSPPALNSYGIVSSQHLVTALSANLTTAQRERLDQAVAARNASLSQANAQLSATLREVLGETNEGLNDRIMSPAEAQRMENMRRAQPARYLHLMSKKKRELKKQRQNR